MASMHGINFNANKNTMTELALSEYCTLIAINDASSMIFSYFVVFSMNNNIQMTQILY